jgi:hypothetical protein
VDAVTQHLLVRWPDNRRLPRGTIGRYSTTAARIYVKVGDVDAFEAWAAEQGLADGCGHVSKARERLIRRRVEDALRVDPGTVLPPGLRLGTDGRVRLRVWPIGVRNVDELEAFMWESAVDVVRPRPSRRVRSARRSRWRS